MAIQITHQLIRNVIFEVTCRITGPLRLNYQPRFRASTFSAISMDCLHRQDV